MFGQLEHTEQSIQTRNGLVMFAIILMIMIPLQNAILLFPDEVPVFRREQSSNMYSVTVYYLSKIAGEMPIVIITNFLICFILYFGCQMNTETASHFIQYFSLSLVVVLMGTGLGLLGGAITPNKAVAIDMIPAVMLFPFLLSGFFVSQDNALPILKPFIYISPFKWAYQSYLLIEYDDLHLDCYPSCDPFESIGFSENKNESIIATVAITTIIYIFGYLILAYQAYKAK